MIIDVIPLEERISKKSAQIILTSFQRMIEHQRDQIDLLTRRNLDLEIQVIHLRADLKAITQERKNDQ